MAVKVILMFTIAVMAIRGGASSDPLGMEASDIADRGSLNRRLISAEGYWSTSGSKIVDSTGDEVFFSGVNWNGFEGSNCVVDGIWETRSYRSHLEQMADLGFNMIRLPFAGACVQLDVKPTSINYALNPDLVNLTSLDVMRKISEVAGKFGLRIILDYHRLNMTDPKTGNPEKGLWFDDNYSPEYYLDTWKLVARHLKNVPSIVGVDLFNEPYSAIWDESDMYHNWRQMAQRVGDALQTIQPAWLICVEGMARDSNWGGNLQDLVQYPLNLTVPNKLVYSVHDYGPYVANNSWLEAPDFPYNLEAHWDSIYGFVKIEGIAPVWVGEFGTKMTTTPSTALDNVEYKWITTYLEYIKSKKLMWSYFQWGPNSKDTGGILKDDWQSVEIFKVDFLEPYMYPKFTVTSPEVPPPPSPPFSPPPSPARLPPPSKVLTSPPPSLLVSPPPPPVDSIVPSPPLSPLKALPPPKGGSSPLYPSPPSPGNLFSNKPPSPIQLGAPFEIFTAPTSPSTPPRPSGAASLRHLAAPLWRLAAAILLAVGFLRW